MNEGSTVVLYAPNVHTGGGFVLLQALLHAWSPDRSLIAFLDGRVQDKLSVRENWRVTWVAATVVSRLHAEFALHRETPALATVLCFHGLPPTLPNRGRVVVFLQNRLYIERRLSANFRPRTRLRLTFERWTGQAFRHRVAHYIVQTPSMQRALSAWYKAAGSEAPPISIIPFVDTFPGTARPRGTAHEWDFVYVADGEAHKNHRTLLAAWKLLAQEGLRPSLALTLGPRDATLAREMELVRAEANLRVRNLGTMPRAEVFSLYATARAAIFPSTFESFGLPLLEAAHAGLPILAGELDYVRDVCTPAQTFDPCSAVSIFRAVKRFMDIEDPPMAPCTTGEFWAALVRPAMGDSPPRRKA